MPEQNLQSTEVFLRSHQMRYDAVKSCLQQLAEAFGKNNQDEILQKGTELHTALLSLNDNLSPRDRPNWIKAALQELNKIQSNPNHAGRISWLVAVLTNCYLPAMAQQWDFQAIDDGAFDFDGLYERHRAQSKLPELFEKLITLLEKIVESEELDSRKVERTLRVLIATLKKNRQGSFMSMVFSWNFAATFLRKLAWELPKEMPWLRAFSNALRGTIDEITTEIDGEMGKVYEQMADDVQKQLGVHLSALQYTPLPALTNETEIIDVEANPVPDGSMDASAATK
jgi:hypothetical protein